MIKKISSVIILGLTITINAGDKYILNEVLAVITGGSRASLVLAGDIKPSLDGRPRTLRDIVLEELMLLDAEKLHLTATDDDVEKYLKQLQKAYSQKQIEESLQAMGFTMADVREQLKRQDVINRLLDYRVRNDKRLVINRPEIEEYWAANAPTEEATISLCQTNIKTSETKEQLEKRIADHKLTEAITWGPVFTLKESEIMAGNRFITQKNVGDIVLISPSEEGFELTKIADKKASYVMPLVTGNKEEDDQRIAAIEEKLRVQCFNDIRAEYDKSLLDKAKIKFTYESDRRAVFGE